MGLRGLAGNTRPSEVVPTSSHDAMVARELDSGYVEQVGDVGPAPLWGCADAGSIAAAMSRRVVAFYRSNGDCADPRSSAVSWRLCSTSIVMPATSTAPVTTMLSRCCARCGVWDHNGDRCSHRAARNCVHAPSLMSGRHSNMQRTAGTSRRCTCSESNRRSRSTSRRSHRSLMISSIPSPRAARRCRSRLGPRRARGTGEASRRTRRRGRAWSLVAGSDDRCRPQRCASPARTCVARLAASRRGRPARACTAAELAQPRASRVDAAEFRMNAAHAVCVVEITAMSTAPCANIGRVHPRQPFRRPRAMALLRRWRNKSRRGIIRPHL